MSPLKILAAVLIAGLLPAAYVALNPGDGSAEEPAPDEVAGAEDAEARRDRGRVAPPLLIQPGDESSEESGSEGEIVDVFGHKAVIPAYDEDPALFANGRLTLRASVEPGVPTAGLRFQLVATFGNEGTDPVRFHIPEHVGLVPFPGWRLRHESGDVYEPLAVSFQSMWQKGIQGAVVTLQPGEERIVKCDGSGFKVTRTDGSTEGDWQKRLPLAAGRYTVELGFENSDKTVPVGKDNFGMSKKEIPSLWTGKVEAERIAVLVSEDTRPTLKLSAPEQLDPAGDYSLTLTIRHPGRDPVDLDGSFRIWMGEKGTSHGTAHFRFGDVATPLGSNEHATLHLEPGEERTCRIDLVAMHWRSGDYGRARSIPPHSVRGDGLPHISVDFQPWEEASDGSNTLVTAEMFRAVTGIPALAERDRLLSLDVERVGTDSPVLHVVLTNGGDEPLRLPSRMSFPLDVTFTFRPANEERDGWWDALLGREFQGPGATLRPITPDELVELAPRDSLDVRVPLLEAFPEAREAGRYSIRAAWRNLDAGGREGFGEAPVVVGYVFSDAVEVDIPHR
jgi:hypothetical protein